jgi:serine protease AprX
VDTIGLAARPPVEWGGGGTVRAAVRAVIAVVVVMAMAAIAATVPVSRPASVWTATWKADLALVRQAAAHPSGTLQVIVREATPASDGAERLVRSLGGSVGRELGLVHAFAATIPGTALEPLAESPAVLRIWGDARLTSHIVDTRKYDTWSANTVWRGVIGANGIGVPGKNGAGVTVALLDTGVAQVPDLQNRVIERVDLTQDQDGLDHYGHGTHMAGIIVGDGTSSNGAYTGLAPGANLVSIKVASWDGSTDVSEIIAGLQWAVAHQAQYGIRVLNLSYGTDGTQAYKLDPLDYAVEQVWLSGVVVVVAAGNRGPSSGTVDKPGDDPFVITVGAANVHDQNAGKPVVEADFSGRGPTQDKFAKPDLLAPGISIVSLRDPGSTVDMLHPDAAVGDWYFKGTGTSQATAVVSGIVADMFQQNPSLTPDMAKAILLNTAKPTSSASHTPIVSAAGALSSATTYAGPPANQGLLRSTGLGKIEPSRGTFHVYASPGAGNGNPKLLKGEYDVFWDKWVPTAWGSNAWSSSPFVDYTAETSGWESGFAKKCWKGADWDATAWDKKGWKDAGWTTSTWTTYLYDFSTWG